MNRRTPNVTAVSDGGCGRRRGNVLVVVLGLVAAVSVLGIAYIEDNGLSVQGAFNLSSMSRARYVAESGVEEATYWLSQTSPPHANAQGYWPGATGRHVDSTDDYYDVTVVRDSSNRNRYTITSIGYATSRGAALSHKTVAVVTVSPLLTVTLPYALHLDAFSWLAHDFRITGDVHCNNTVYSDAIINGNLTASGWMVYWTKPTGSAQALQPTSQFPPLNVSAYTSYLLEGTTYTAATYTSETIGTPSNFAGTDPNHSGSSQWNVSATNPGGVLKCTYRPGYGTRRVVLSNGCDFTGTIICDGDVYLNGKTITVTPLPGFPAIVCTGNLYVSDNNADITLNGAVIVGGTLAASVSNIKKSWIAANGPVHFGGGLSLFADWTGMTINPSADRKWLYDVTGTLGTGSGGPVTVQSWQ
ncbi:MAG: hypothetical protein BIFFINMI_01611 [Phycisphaerae bacterium]|nr:hypothetical protein [Phycisphaerae bacterium]